MTIYFDTTYVFLYLVNLPQAMKLTLFFRQLAIPISSGYLWIPLFQEIIKGAGHSSAIDWWALGKHMKKHVVMNVLIPLFPMHFQ